MAGLRRRLHRRPDEHSLDYARHWNPATLSQARQMINVEDDAEYFSESGKHFGDQIVGLLGDTPDKVVLDLGCGIGRIAGFVAPHAGQLVAVDLSERMLQLARQNLAAFPNVHYLQSSANSISEVDDQSIDLVYSVLVLQHLEREDAFSMMREIRRVLRPGGRAYLNFPNLLHEVQLEAFIAYVDTGAVSNEARARFYTSPEVDRLLRAAGFPEVEVSDDIGGALILALCRTAPVRG